MATITKEEYVTQLKGYITDKMKELTHDSEPVSFWIQFNKDRQIEFDDMLAANGVTVVE
jgi:hypothetical protein